jgi:hypothetical protein
MYIFHGTPGLVGQTQTRTLIGYNLCLALGLIPPTLDTTLHGCCYYIFLPLPVRLPVFFLNSTVHNGTIPFTESFVYTMECIVLGSCYYSTLLVLQSTQIVMKNDVPYILLKYELFLYKTSNRLHPLICRHLRCVFSHVINSY